MIIVMATIVAKPEGRAALEALAMECVKETRKESGCISYELYAALEEQNRAMFVERWESQAALDAHMRTPHFKKYAAGSEPLLARAPEVFVYEAKEAK